MGIVTALYVAAGGALGSVSRYGMAQLALMLFPDRTHLTNWIGTLSVNVLGSFLIAFLTVAIRAALPDKTFLFPLLTVGFCGGFTTFSTFALDGVKLYQGGDVRGAIFYVLLSLILSVLSVFLGFRAAERLFG